SAGQLYLQSRGHFLSGGVREKHFDLFKQWATAHSWCLWERFGDRYALFGGWVYGQPHLFYHALAGHFLWFDVLDLEEDRFLTTSQRRHWMRGLPIVSAPVLYRGRATTLDHLLSLLGPSRYKSPSWREALVEACAEQGIGPEQAWKETDTSD